MSKEVYSNLARRLGGGSGHLNFQHMASSSFKLDAPSTIDLFCDYGKGADEGSTVCEGVDEGGFGRS